MPSNPDNTKNILLAGRPGVGKTTLVRKVVESGRVIAGGFYTEEIREAGRRMGFMIRTLDGREGVLAHVKSRSAFRVGRYGVNVDAFEDIGVRSIEDALTKDGLVVMDEIGRMELFSGKFQQTVIRALDAPLRVFGVIQMKRNTFLNKIRSRPDTHRVNVTMDNRDALLPEILGLLR
ncbi:MAG: NTPase [Planctomycetes bacterium]|nr:NTPase [Planctomycetota bacterium]